MKQLTKRQIEEQYAAEIEQRVSLAMGILRTVLRTGPKKEPYVTIMRAFMALNGIPSYDGDPIQLEQTTD